VNRRHFTASLSAAVAASVLTSRASAQQAAPAKASPNMTAMTPPAGPPTQIAMLLYPDMYPLDLVGPYTFLSGLMNAEVHLVAKDLTPVGSKAGLKLSPTTTFAGCPRDLDVLFVPGGIVGTNAMLADDTTLDFLADRGARARYVTSVCTGSLLLGAAGLLKGYRATSHWNTRDLLPTFGALPVAERVVTDRNRITGGGVTSGIDFGLVLAAKLRGTEYAQMLQLVNEYDPQPPFHAGTPTQAGPILTAHIDDLLLPLHQAAQQAALAAVQRRHLS
jgi:cyclohexyl-isocyanide hydratase